MSTIILIRAGSTDYDNSSRLLGLLEMPMNQEGLLEIDRAAKSIQGMGLTPDVILSAPEDPSAGTARAIADRLKVSRVRELDELRNVNQGLWQGLPESEVRKRYPRMFRQCRERPQTICAPEGESLSDACQRLKRIFNKAIQKYDVFAVVAVEPLATVIHCTLQRRGLNLASCLCGEDRKLVEQFEAEEFDPGAFVNYEIASETEEPAHAGSEKP